MQLKTDMMRVKNKVLWLCFLVIVSLHGNAQSWAPHDAVWRYNFLGLGGQGYVQITYVKDTMVDGVNCKRLNKRLFQENAFTGTVQSYNIGSVFTYENNGIVFIRFGGSFDTLYNFNAVPGESWNVPGTSPVNTCNSVTKIEVLDTATVLINNVPLKRIIVHYQYNSNPSAFFRDTLIERIGSLRQYMVPWDMCMGMVDGNEGGDLRCYTDNVVGEFKHNFYSDCTAVIGIEENEFSRNVTVFPNPVSDMLHIASKMNFPENMQFRISFFESTGMLLFSLETEDINAVVNLNAYPAGMYYLLITNSRNESMSRRILKF